MLKSYLEDLPQSVIHELETSVLRGLDLAEQELKTIASFSVGPGINNRGRHIHQTVDHQLYTSFKFGSDAKAARVGHSSGQFVLVAWQNFEISTMYLGSRTDTPTITACYQIERAVNNPSDQGHLFGQEVGESPYFVLLCYGVDQDGPFAFLYFPSSGLYKLEKLNLRLVKSQSAADEEVAEKKKPFADKKGEAMSS